MPGFLAGSLLSQPPLDLLFSRMRSLLRLEAVLLGQRVHKLDRGLVFLLRPDRLDILVEEDQRHGRFPRLKEVSGARRELLVGDFWGIIISDLLK